MMKINLSILCKLSIIILWDINYYFTLNTYAKLKWKLLEAKYIRISLGNKYKNMKFYKLIYKISLLTKLLIALTNPIFFN